MSYSSVCSTGLDAIPLPGDVSEHDSGEYHCRYGQPGGEVAQALSVRMLPVAGKHAGDLTELAVRIW